MDFNSDLRKIAEDSLDRYGLSHSENDSIDDILNRWINLQLRLIKQIPRTIFISDNVLNIELSTTEKFSLQAIKEKISIGADCNPHLSTRIFQEDYTDYLFSDWGIYHLHLKTDPYPNNPYSVDRSDKLLFLMMNDTNAYFIDIRRHDEEYVFANRELLRVVHNMWPDLIKKYRIKVGTVEKEFTDEEINTFRKAGVSIITKVDNDSYVMIGGGITTAATSARVTLMKNDTLRMVRYTEQWAQTNEINLLNVVRTKYPNQTRLDLHLILNEKVFSIEDTISKITWPISSFDFLI